MAILLGTETSLSPLPSLLPQADPNAAIEVLQTREAIVTNA
jgi:hypothetical protein